MRGFFVYGKINALIIVILTLTRLTTMKLTLALAQINTKLGDVDANLEQHLALAHAAWKGGADLIMFPELSLTGYVLQDLAPTVARRPEAQDPVFQQLLHASKNLDMVVGFVEEDPRYRYYIASAYLSGGEIVHVHRKVYLPTYGIFDEKRYFATGDSFEAFETRFGRAGILICEDFWHISSPYSLWLDGADLFWLTSASPGRGVTDEIIGSAQWVQDVNRAYSGLFTSFFAHANRVGFEDGLNFFGGSTVFDPDGRMITQAPFNDPGLTFAELDLNQLRRTRMRLPLLRDERPEILLKQLEKNNGKAR
jgi:NAD+ synthase (glutamine-hydrolysing)